MIALFENKIILMIVILYYKIIDHTYKRTKERFHFENTLYVIIIPHMHTKIDTN